MKIITRILLIIILIGTSIFLYIELHKRSINSYFTFDPNPSFLLDHQMGGNDEEDPILLPNLDTLNGSSPMTPPGYDPIPNLKKKTTEIKLENNQLSKSEVDYRKARDKYVQALIDSINVLNTQLNSIKSILTNSKYKKQPTPQARASFSDIQSAKKGPKESEDPAPPLGLIGYNSYEILNASSFILICILGVFCNLVITETIDLRKKGIFRIALRPAIKSAFSNNRTIVAIFSLPFLIFMILNQLGTMQFNQDNAYLAYITGFGWATLTGFTKEKDDNANAVNKTELSAEKNSDTKSKETHKQASPRSEEALN